MLSIDPEVIRGQRHVEIGQIIERDAVLLVEKWFQRALGELPSASQTYRRELADHLPAFLTAMGHELAASNAEGLGPHRMLALEHGEQRWHVGWQLADVVRDYQILRLVVLDHLEGLLTRPLAMREVLAVGLALDEAIAAAVVMYSSYQETHLREAELRSRSVLDHVIDGIFCLDGEGQILSLNPAAERIFARNAADLMGRSISDLIEVPADPAALVAFLRSAADGTGGTGCEVVGRRSNGAAFPVDLATSEYYVGATPFFTAIVRDITERKTADRELERYADALELANATLEEISASAANANRAKSEFLASMSHEIRTPMTAILGFTEMLLEAAENAEQRDALQTIHRNGDFLLEIINDILDLSKIEAGRLEIERMPCSPAEIVRDVQELMQLRAAEKMLSLDVEFVGLVPRTIHSDPTRLRQVLVNLIGNAIKFTDQGGVRLVTRLLIDGETPQLEFAVIDTGIGMTDAEIQVVFQPFAQADSTVSRRFGGTGLGLTISNRLAEMLGGRITIESVKGHGSVFRASLAVEPLDKLELVRPTMKAVSQPAETRSAQGSSSALEPITTAAPRLDCRVLVADDRRDNQHLISRLLTTAGAHVEVADNGLTVLDLVDDARKSHAPFDIILLDMQMPELDGYQTAERLRAAGVRTPIIALTASAMKGDRERCLAAGCDEYTAKPIDSRRLLELVAKYCGKSGR